MKTDAPFGCMVTLFVKRTSLPEAIESVQNSHEALTEHAQHPLASAEDQELAVLGDLRSLHIEVDQDDRIWVDDVATVQ